MAVKFIFIPALFKGLNQTFFDILLTRKKPVLSIKSYLMGQDRRIKLLRIRFEICGNQMKVSFKRKIDRRWL